MYSMHVQIMNTWILCLFIFTLMSEINCRISDMLVITPLRITKFNVRIRNNSDIISLHDNLSLVQCAEKCAFRQNCVGMVYSRRYLQCDIVEEMKNNTFEEMPSSVFVSRKNIQEHLWVTPLMCEDCNTCLFDTYTGYCENKDCPKFVRSGEGTLMGNMRQIGSKVKVSCRDDLVMIDGDAFPVCEGSGTWSSQPKCLADCGEPRVIQVKNVAVDPGPTYEGTNRTFRCINDNFVTRQRNKTEVNVTCSAEGKWGKEPRCVRDCLEAKPAADFNAANRTGTDMFDYAKRVYTCPENYTVLLTKNVTVSGVKYINQMMNTNKRVLLCNGLTRTWFDIQFKCVKDCLNRPDPENVKSIATLFTSNATEIHYECKDGYVIFENYTLTDDVTRVSRCTSESDDGRLWTNSDFTCVLGCEYRPNPTNVANETVIHDENSTTILYTCEPGHVIFKDDKITMDTSGESTCEEESWAWTSPDLMCIKDCSNPPSTTNVMSTLFRSDATSRTLIYRCTPDHVIYFTASMSLTTQEESGEFVCTISAGPWEGENFMCVPDCGPIPYKPTTDDHAVNATEDLVSIVYNCPYGKTIKDNSGVTEDVSKTIYCTNPGGTWDTNFWCT